MSCMCITECIYFGKQASFLVDVHRLRRAISSLQEHLAVPSPLTSIAIIVCLARLPPPRPVASASINFFKIMSLKFYYDLLSQPSRALYIFLKKCNIPFEKKIVNLKDLEQYTPEFEEINRFKKVPVIDHDGFKLAESVGIVRYLSREFKVDDHWYPSDSKKQAKVDEYLEWQHLNTRLHCATYFLTKFLNPLMRGKPPKPEKVAEFESRMNDCIDLIENVWLKDTPFLIGNTISVADIFCACELEQPRIAGYDPKKGRPRLTAWMERVMSETSPHYQDAHKFLNQMAAQNPTQNFNFKL
ncbi:glutathione S-transferase theta-3 isoform X1 [Solenopsis invicta]|uniref:glutathione S-transferase theta-3 isoform X1 n=2 Tax=Solenopsis invicta TaxID=13686 RepID=UPI00193E4194|nr:glutathione S-transferase theta-3 isoform X1 [Solenopsis invicta]